MPELPDIEAYVNALRSRVSGKPLARLRIKSPFVLRSVNPPVREAEGRTVVAVARSGKRIVLSLDNDVHVAIHLMIAGRLKWAKPGAAPGLASFDFPDGTVVFTEAGSKHRASIHLLRAFPRAEGVEPLSVSVAEFAAVLRSENHTIKRSLTMPSMVSGIGNAYSDEILHQAKMSPVLLTSRMSDADFERLHVAMRDVLSRWSEKLRSDKWPAKVTAFQDEFSAHGKFGQQCPACGTLIQRIVRGEHETNYCPRCQTGGKMLADRALSKLLHDDWPATIEAWESKQMPRGD